VIFYTLIFYMGVVEGSIFYCASRGEIFWKRGGGGVIITLARGYVFNISVCGIFRFCAENLEEVVGFWGNEIEFSLGGGACRVRAGEFSDSFVEVSGLHLGCWKRLIDDVRVGMREGEDDEGVQKYFERKRRLLDEGREGRAKN
jgi:hypothetical protein